MGLRVEELLKQALELPGEDRVQLAEALLSSVEPCGALPFDPDWLEEVKRRAARIDSGESRLST